MVRYWKVRRKPSNRLRDTSLADAFVEISSNPPRQPNIFDSWILNEPAAVERGSTATCLQPPFFINELPERTRATGDVEGRGEKGSKKRDKRPCVDTTLTFVTRVWISLQRQARGRASKGESDSSWSPSPPSVGWKGKEQRKTNCGRRRSPSPRFQLLSPIVFIPLCLPVNQPPLIACGYYRGTTGGPIIRTPLPVFPQSNPPSFLIFTYLPWLNQRTSSSGISVMQLSNSIGWFACMRFSTFQHGVMCMGLKRGWNRLEDVCLCFSFGDCIKIHRAL